MAQSRQDSFLRSVAPALSAAPQNDMAVVVASLGTNDNGGLSELFGGLSKHVEALVAANEIQSSTTETNTQAILQNTSLQASGVKGTLGGVGQVAGSIVGSGLGLVSLASAIGKLFGGHKDEEPAPLVRFSLPQSERLEMASRPDGISPMDYGIGGQVRVMRTQTAMVPAAAASIVPSPNPAVSITPAADRPTHITVQVQAMDSRSFMDHSGDIARAVREAMLSMHPLNDVVNDL